MDIASESVPGVPGGQCGVIFDLDGTLLDTLRDIAAAANQVLLELKFPEHSVEKYRFLVGDGVRVLFQRALPDGMGTERVVDRCVELFERHYAETWDRTSVPYDGIKSLLEALERRRVPMAVLSNKPHAFTLQCVLRFFTSGQFDPVFGQRPNVARKPDPAGVDEICRHWGIPAGKVFYLGDTNTDMWTACAAGCVAVGVTWGFRQASELEASGARFLIDEPAELLPLLDTVG
jgi:phosphoglycolate phosphatase